MRVGITRYLVLALLVFAATSSFAQGGFTRVLIPVAVRNVPGAYGTSWSTELWFRNDSGVPVYVFQLAVSDYVPPVGVNVLLPLFDLPANNPGTFLTVSREGIERVQFDLRLFNGTDATWGVQLPVVRDEEFTEEVNLLNVPGSTAFRSALRVYGLPDSATDTETLIVSVYSYEEELLASKELSFGGQRLYAQMISLADEFPEIRQSDRVRVHVTSRSGTAKLWAFITVVSNETQNVAVIAPNLISAKP